MSKYYLGYLQNYLDKMYLDSHRNTFIDILVCSSIEVNSTLILFMTAECRLMYDNQGIEVVSILMV